MLHILLVILKILGIILACLLGLLLLLILIVLFVPIRYRMDAKKREEIIIKMRVSWLLRIVFVRIWFINKQLHIKLRIFGFTFWDNLRPKKEKKAKKKKISKEKSSKKDSKKQDSKKQNAGKQNLEKQNLEKQIDAEGSSTRTVNLSKESPELVVDQKKLAESNQDDPGDLLNQEKKIEDLPTKLDEVTKKATKKEAGKFRKILNKIKGFFQKLSKLGNTIKDKWNKLLDLIKKVFEKKNLVSVFLKDELNKAGIKLALGQLLEVLKYCGPQKIEGYVKFGTGDPESTGKLLGAVAFLYGYYGKSVTIEPDFENKVFEAEGMVKGRIRIIRLLIIGIKVIRDKNFKKLVKNARQLKEEL